MIQIGAAKQTQKEVFLPFPVINFSKETSMSKALFETRDSLQAEFDCLQLDLTVPSGDLSSESIHNLNTAILPKASPVNDTWTWNWFLQKLEPWRWRGYLFSVSVYILLEHFLSWFQMWSFHFALNATFSIIIIMMIGRALGTGWWRNHWWKHCLSSCTFLNIQVR